MEAHSSLHASVDRGGAGLGIRGRELQWPLVRLASDGIIRSIIQEK